MEFFVFVFVLFASLFLMVAPAPDGLKRKIVITHIR